MFAIIGFIIVIGSIAFGNILGGGDFKTLWQPGEFLIILGSAFGTLFIANKRTDVISTLTHIPIIFRGPKYKSKDFTELLCLLFTFFKLAKTKGDLALESHVEDPKESSIFSEYPKVIANHEARDFICDYLRLLTIGANNPNETCDIMDADIEAFEHELHTMPSALQVVADAMPALGIVAAVLGVIHTMGAINEPPEILGHLIAAALVGTFCGVLAAYGFVGPIASGMAASLHSEIDYIKCIKAGIIAHMSGYAPQVSVEFARKVIAPDTRPSFTEVDEAIANISIGGNK
ncbi:MAG: flagellar motor stator protein MotA [Alphaproteobacteria bacterium]|nr:flagellar motor stator protein MotA [Alphaproteobacteria bacterium]